MYTLLALLAGLGGAALAAFVHLVRRDRNRRTDDATGLLTEQLHSARAAAMRQGFTSHSVHHGGGSAPPADPHRR